MTRDDDLAALIAAWPNLPEAARAGINAMVQAYTAVPPTKPKRGR